MTTDEMITECKSLGAFDFYERPDVYGLTLTRADGRVLELQNQRADGDPLDPHRRRKLLQDALKFARDVPPEPTLNPHPNGDPEQ
jgi:hypothetical protein